MPSLSTLIRAFSLLSLACSILLPQARAQAPAANTDPARAQVVLPEPANAALPSIILIGDSTVRNGHDDGQGKGAEGQWGWGNPLASHFDPARVNVVNRAVGGLSSRTYLSSGHWERALALVQPGDIVIMQFGHNDASPVNDDKRARGTLRGIGEHGTEIDNLLTGKRETVHSYGWYLRKFIADARARGAMPVVASLIPSKAWNEDGPQQGKVRRNKDDYAGWAAEVARLEKVGFIDLNEQVARRYDEMGRAAVDTLFPSTVPEERIHTNWAGAVLNAQYVVEGLKALGDPRLPGWLKPAEDVRPVVDPRSVREEAPRDAGLPTLFLVGDSTVKSGGQNGAIGWGERIAPYFDTRRINVVNAAIGGRSSRTFYTEGRWQRVLQQLKRGDTVLIQFGHNDGGRIGDPANKNRASAPGIGAQTVEDTLPDGSKVQVHSFGWYLARYVDEARAKGAMVVIASPIPHRDKWQQERDFASFAEWGRQVAQAGGAHFMDLTMLVSAGYRALGAQRVDTFFSDARTHTNAAGAEFNAQRVVAGLKALPGSPLRQYLSEQGSGIQ
jgi:lysophospholipase L1-like esterase